MKKADDGIELAVIFKWRLSFPQKSTESDPALIFVESREVELPD